MIGMEAALSQQNIVEEMSLMCHTLTLHMQNVSEKISNLET